MASTTVSSKFSISTVYQSVRLSLILDLRHEGETYPIAVRITYQRKRYYYLTGLRLTEQDYVKMIRSKKGIFYELLLEQQKIFDKVVSVVKRLVDDDIFTIDNLKQSLSGQTSVTINDAFKKKIELLKENNQHSTAYLYQFTEKKLKEFYGGDIPFSELSVSFLEKFRKFMEKTGCNPTTIGIYFRHIRAVCNYSIANGYMKESQYPFKSTKSNLTNYVRIPRATKRKDRFLEVSEILKLMSYDTPEHKKTPYDRLVCESLNMWLFSYLGNGMNLMDMAFLTYDEHYFRSKGKELSFKRKKTENTLSEELVIYVPLIAPLKAIMEEYATTPKLGRRLFPQILGDVTAPETIMKVLAQENKNIADRLGKVCESVGIEERVTMTWARHSYQTNLAHKKVPESYIDQAVGHADETVTDSYIGLYSIEDRFRYNSLLLDPDKEA